eukprot:6206364-Pleurochrysis_carterae.AAC.6
MYVRTLVRTRTQRRADVRAWCAGTCAHAASREVLPRLWTVGPVRARLRADQSVRIAESREIRALRLWRACKPRGFCPGRPLSTNTCHRQDFP